MVNGKKGCNQIIHNDMKIKVSLLANNKYTKLEVISLVTCVLLYYCTTC